MRRALLVAALLALPACSQAPSDGDTAVVLVSAPLTGQPWVGRNVQRGAELAAARSEGRVRVEVLDNGGSPQRAAAHARQAVADGVAAMVIDGVGAAAVAEVTDPARLPVFVVFEGGGSFIDPEENPSLFRLAPADRAMTRRLADYLSEGADRVGVVSDDSSYGREGADAVAAALDRNEVTVTTRQTVPQGSSDVAAQVLQARRSGAQALVVWARAEGVAAVLRAARQTGWQVPVYSGPTAADPLVRQRVADRPQWLEGLTFVSFRITSEVGPEPFAEYRAAYEAEHGVEQVVGDVVQPPDWSTYSYDAVTLVQAAREAGGPLLEALESTVITGANGDERGFGPTDREGVSPDDMYFARFSGDLRFAPVDDDVLSENLPTVEQ